MNASPRRFVAGLLVVLLFLGSSAFAAPLRVYIRAGAKTHGPGQHDHPRFLEEWSKLLADRGAKVAGSLEFPSSEELEAADVLVMYAPDPWDMTADQRGDLESFLARGGGLVVIHDAICGQKDPEWVKTVVGGSWKYGKAKWFEGDVSLYYVDREHPITAGASNFDLDDEMYYELDFLPEARVLASTWTPDDRAKKNGRAFPHIYDTAAQMWTYEKGKYRAFVSLPGHNHATFSLPHYRAVLLRGIAWAGHRKDVNELCEKEELDTLLYPAGGPARAADSLTKAVVHPDFTMKLVATEPLLNKPMAIDWDADSRLWVAETVEYPNGRRGIKPEFAGREWKDGGSPVAEAGKQDRPARDRISILTDTDGDGVMDRKQVFYEGLELVTGFVFHRDGVIAAAAPDVWFIRDTDGDGKADKAEKLYTGLGSRDTHAVINNLRWGFDGYIYATHGYSSGAVRSAVNGKDFGNIGSGVVRFTPDGSHFEQYSSKGGNTWGLTFTWDGEAMWTQPTSGDLLLHTVLPEHQLSLGKVEKTASFQVVSKSPKSVPLMTWEQQAYRQIDWVGSFTAAAGCAIYDGGTWPAEYNGDYFTTEPTINIVHHQRLQPAGVSYSARKLRDEEFIGSRDLWFRPIEARVGPDGSLYLADFYNQAVIHNDTRGPVHNGVNAAVRPDRDHYFGRIWRVDHKQAKPWATPHLSKATNEQLIAALRSPNQHVRLTAARLLVEKGGGAEPVAALLRDAQAPAAARVQALWVLQRLGKMTPQLINAAVADADPAVARHGLKAAAEQRGVELSPLVARLQDGDARVRLAAIAAVGAAGSAEGRKALVDLFPKLQDPYEKSALVGVANSSPADFLLLIAQSADPRACRELTRQLASQLVKSPAAEIARALSALAPLPTPADPVKETVLGELAEAKPEARPDFAAVLEPFRLLLASNVREAALPVIAAWDRQGVLAAEVSATVADMIKRLQAADGSREDRPRLVRNLIRLRTANAEILPRIGRLLAENSTDADLKRTAILELGDTPEKESGLLLVAAYPALDPALRDLAFAQLLKRADWTRSFIEAISAKKVELASLGPVALDKLRHYPDAAVADQAARAIDAIRGPMLQEKEKVIGTLLASVEQGGDPLKGEQIFLAACALCHRFNGKGSNLGPEITGMGAHPRAELLTHIVDPNREVDPSFAAWDFSTKKGENYQGIIVRENAQSVVVRDAAGEHEIAKSEVAARKEVGRSLMPEGFEALGAETLRDVIAYLQSGDSKFRIVDLKPAFTADSRRGLFVSPDRLDDTIKFKRFGSVKVGDAPFVISDPATTGSGKNLIVLKGGEGLADTYPQRVTIPAGRMQAKALHFLGGVGGWAFPCCGNHKDENLPVAKVTVHYDEGGSEELVFRNGVEFADYIRPFDVPGSKSANDLVNANQVRVFRKELARGGVIDRLVIESFDNRIAPVFAAITAEQGSANSAAPMPAASVSTQDAPIRILAFGGGSSHDFRRWFGDADRAILAALRPSTYDYTENPDQFAAAAPKLDLLYLTTNQPLSSGARQGIFEMAAAGKGLLLVHPALWYNWGNFPEYNRQLVGGGARSHDKFGPFDVEVVNRNHPVMAGLPERFRITDELYHFIPDPQGAQIEILAQATSPVTGKTFPQIWIVKHPSARIVCIALGHDGQAHDLPEFKLLLQNAARWAGQKGS